MRTSQRSKQNAHGGSPRRRSSPLSHSFEDVTTSIYEWLVRISHRLARILIARTTLTLTLLLIAGGIYFAGYASARTIPLDFKTVANDLYINLSSELIGIAVTVALVDLLASIRQQYTEKQLLIHQLTSPNNMFAIEAARILENKGWHRDGTLWRKNLHFANLSNAHLRDFEFRNSILDKSNLSNSDLGTTNFTKAGLRLVNLTAAQLAGTILRGADLTGANLRNASIVDIQIDETTILPDGKRWSQQEDLFRFTDPDHPNFWKPR